MALLQRPLGLDRILEAADADDRQVDGLADRRRDEHRVAGRDVHRRLDHEQRRRRHADRGVDVVDLPGGLDDARDADRVVDGGAALDQLVAADAHAERESGADRRRARRRRSRRRMRARFASEPPYSSVRLLVAGDRKPRTIELWEHCSSMPSKPPSRAVPGHERVARRRSRRSRRGSTAFGTSRNSGSGTGDGAHTGSRLNIDDAWPPLWLIWAKIGVPWRCTASVMRR